MLRLPEKGDEDNHPIGSGKVFFTDIFSGIKTRNTVCRKTQEGGKGGKEKKEDQEHPGLAMGPVQLLLLLLLLSSGVLTRKYHLLCQHFLLLYL